MSTFSREMAKMPGRKTRRSDTSTPSPDTRESDSRRKRRRAVVAENISTDEEEMYVDQCITCHVDPDPNPSKRQRMRPFLREHLESGRVGNLRWTNRDRGEFEVLWRHKARHGWNETDAEIFKLWAVHTGNAHVPFIRYLPVANLRSSSVLFHATFMPIRE